MSTVTIEAETAANQPNRHRSIGQSVTRGALALLSTQPLTWGATILTTVAFPRLLGAESLGQLAIATSIAAMAAMASGLGISEFLVRRIAQRPQDLRHDISVALLVQLVTAVIGVLVAGILGPMVSSSIVDPRLLRVALLTVVGAPAQTVLLSSFRGREMHASYAWFNAAGVVAGTLGSVLVLLAGGDVVAAQGTSGLAWISVSIITWKLSGLRFMLPSIDRALVADAFQFVRRGFPFVTWQLTLLAYGEVDRVLLGAMVPAYEVGWYTAAYRIISMTIFIPNLVMAPLFPALSRGANDWDSLRRTIAQTIRVLLVLMVGLCACTVVAAPLLPRLLGWPQDFDNAVPLIMILALHVPSVAVDMVLGTLLMAIHRESRWVMVGMVATVFNIGANLLIIPYIQATLGNGAIGAGIVTVMTEILMFFGAVILIPKRLLDPASIWLAARLVVAGMAAALVGLAFQPMIMAWLTIVPVVLVVSGLAAAMTYVVVAALLRAVTLDDATELRSRLKWRKR